MKIQQSHIFTYNDVKAALEKHFAIKLRGITIGGPAGYCMIECVPENQPAEPSEEQITKEPPPF